MVTIIAMAVMLFLGALMFFAPEKCTRADQRDNPQAVAQVKKFGIVFFLFAIAMGIKMLKYLLV